MGGEFVTIAPPLSPHNDNNSDIRSNSKVSNYLVYIRHSMPIRYQQVHFDFNSVLFCTEAIDNGKSVYSVSLVRANKVKGKMTLNKR